MSLARRQGAAEVTALIRGFREKKPNLRQIFRGLTGEGRPNVDYEEMQELLEESNARVDPEARRKQLELKESLEKNREN